MCFYPKSKKNWNLYKFLQNPKFCKLKKKRICCRTVAGQLACQILGCYMYFWQTYSPIKVSVDDVIFFKLRFSAFLGIAQKYKWHFWKHKIKLVQKHTFLFEKTIRNVGLMRPEVDPTLLCRWLAWSQIAKWPRLLNSTCKSDYTFFRPNIDNQHVFQR